MRYKGTFIKACSFQARMGCGLLLSAILSQKNIMVQSNISKCNNSSISASADQKILSKGLDSLGKS